jgi:signal transduction histidine kinase
MPVCITKLSRAVAAAWRNLSIRYKGGAVIAIPVACLLLTLLCLVPLSREEATAERWTSHTQEVQVEARRLLGDLVAAETGVRGYVITHDPSELPAYQRLQRSLPESLTRLRALVSDNPLQSARLLEIEKLAQQRMVLAGLNVASVSALLTKDPGPAPTAGLAESISLGGTATEALRKNIQVFIDEEDRLLQLRSQRLQDERRLASSFLVLAAGLGIAGGGLAAYLFTQGVSRRLLEIELNAERLTQERELTLQPPGGDEISRVDQQLHAAAKIIADRTSELRDRTERLGRQGAHLEEANRELEAFSYSVSHDLRAPLRHIGGFSKILLDDYGTKLDPEAQSLLGRICQGTAEMGVLIDDLLNLGQIGRGEVKRELTGLDSLLQQVIAELGPELQDRKIDWQLGKLPAVECDPRLVKQVFSNLVSNAVKYTRRQGRARIEVGETAVQGSPAIFIRDNGVGFDMKYADKLFGVFQRLHRADEFEGTGVGLATVSRIVQRHGGKVWAEAQPDLGATFFFTLGTMHQLNRNGGKAI